MPRRSFKVKKSNRRLERRPALIMHSAPNPIPYVQPRNRIEKFRLSGSDIISSTGGGNIFYSLPIDPTGLGIEWSSLAAIYAEFRVMGGLITISSLTPIITSGSSVGNGVAAIAFDPGQFYTPSAITDLLSYSNRDLFQVYSLDRKPYVYGFTFPLAGSGTNLPWFESAVAFTPTACILIAADNLTNSAGYLHIVYDFYVQFRVRS